MGSAEAFWNEMVGDNQKIELFGKEWVLSKTINYEAKMLLARLRENPQDEKPTDSFTLVQACLDPVSQADEMVRLTDDKGLLYFFQVASLMVNDGVSEEQAVELLRAHTNSEVVEDPKDETQS
jgi:hypothetical protein